MFSSESGSGWDNVTHCLFSSSLGRHRASDPRLPVGVRLRPEGVFACDAPATASERLAMVDVDPVDRPDGWLFDAMDGSLCCCWVEEERIDDVSCGLLALEACRDAFDATFDPPAIAVLTKDLNAQVTSFSFIHLFFSPPLGSSNRSRPKKRIARDRNGSVKSLKRN
jgi:hypothetical protein